MATDALTRDHHRAQLALRAATMREFLRLYQGLDLDRLARTWPALERALVALIRENGRISSGLASRYYRQHREALEVPGAPTPRVARVPETAISAGLRIVGPVAAGKALALSRPVQEVADATLVKLAGATSMYVLNHGRESLLASVREDRQALGWARQTSGTPCAFCAMVAGRGAVYKSQQTASFEAHRACACTPVPVYSHDAELPGRADEFGALWDSSTRGLSGRSARVAYRRAYEGRG